MNINTTRQLKGLAILFVIFGHQNYNLGLPSILKWSGGWGVAIFLIISGYGLVISYMKNGLKNFVQKRLYKIYFPYFLVTFIWLIVSIFILGNSYSPQTILLALTGIQNNIDSSMWFFKFIFIQYAFFFLVFKLPFDNIYIKASLLTIVCYLLRPYYSGEVILFPIGIWLALVINKIKKSYYLILIIITALIFLLTVSDQMKPLYYPLTYLSAAICIISLSIYKQFSIRILEQIGNISFELYLLEGAYIGVHNFLKITSYQYFNMFLYLFVLFMLSIVLHNILNINQFKVKEKIKIALTE